MDATAGRTPRHLWVVGVISLLWNGFGAFDYVMSQTRNEAYLAQFSEAERAYFESFPAWTEAAWALGVWGAVLGSVLLLARSRHSVFAFAISLGGLAVSTVFQFVLSSPPASLQNAGMIGLNVFIWIVAIGLLLYAFWLRSDNVLR